ncbi:hypothetical protein OH77DRAFT_1248849 [Trametes cingulata]|nr:hypothetical protein OH77DRAFT_1248849 [Trametes cingulata]
MARLASKYASSGAAGTFTRRYQTAQHAPEYDSGRRVSETAQRARCAQRLREWSPALAKRVVCWAGGDRDAFERSLLPPWQLAGGSAVPVAEPANIKEMAGFTWCIPIEVETTHGGVAEGEAGCVSELQRVLCESAESLCKCGVRMAVSMVLAVSRGALSCKEGFLRRTRLHEEEDGRRLAVCCGGRWVS